MFKLVRDNVPSIMNKNGEICNYAEVQNDELMIYLLHNKLIEEVNEYLSSGDVSELADLKSVIEALVATLNMQKQFDEAYAKKLDERGGFTKKYVAFFNDPAPTASAQEVTK